MAFLVGGANSSAADTGYDIDNSLRFNDGDSPFLSFTPASAGNRRTWTFSCWIKLGTLGINRIIFAGGVGSSTYLRIFDTDVVGFGVSGDANYAVGPILRDPSAWYHLVYKVDTTAGSNRMIIFVNGETVYSGTPSSWGLNHDGHINQDELHSVGKETDGTSADRFFDGYMAEVFFIDGTAHDASDFGETDSDSGIWKPKDCKDDLTFGTNGFYLEFKQTGTSADSSGKGADTSGEDNHYDDNGMTAEDQCTDTPTNNFCTFNPLGVGTNLTYCTFSEGNCKVVKSGTTTDHGNQPIGSMAFSRGKWYFEVKMTNGADTSFIGVFNDVKGGRKPWHENYMYAIYGHGTGSDSQMYSSGEATYLGFGKDEHGGDAFANDDIIGIAFDADDFKFYVSKNGGWTNENSSATANATSGADWSESTPDGYHEIPTAAAKAGFWRFAVLSATNAGAFSTEINFGNPPFAISSGNADANGYGNFEYAVPSGFYALCTKNLAEYG